ncbi:Alpha,alpha-trehalose-phosphate synthase UDP-forming A [Porphyridium purpureum]|uniref:Alpha,alpha-trehalose-phosphate synthase UDP-forming A n=1 Tax=Porphyridium purpureum TaxID=35688 RepID=A0A5J4YYJ5_PORPP|nr:Alpha,alpha-trehalose-phosphate synthase UDP-forming A [Porphyridium purpureum]|eukprot:POR4562..scf209_3
MDLFRRFFGIAEDERATDGAMSERPGAPGVGQEPARDDDGSESEIDDMFSSHAARARKAAPWSSKHQKSRRAKGVAAGTTSSAATSAARTMDDLQSRNNNLGARYHRRTVSAANLVLPAGSSQDITEFGQAAERSADMIQAVDSMPDSVGYYSDLEDDDNDNNEDSHMLTQSDCTMNTYTTQSDLVIAFSDVNEEGSRAAGTDHLSGSRASPSDQASTKPQLEHRWPPRLSPNKDCRLEEDDDSTDSSDREHRSRRRRSSEKQRSSTSSPLYSRLSPRRREVVNVRLNPVADELRPLTESHGISRALRFLDADGDEQGKAHQLEKKVYIQEPPTVTSSSRNTDSQRLSDEILKHLSPVKMSRSQSSAFESFSEDILLAKAQELQLHLAEIRELKDSIRQGAMSGKLSNASAASIAATAKASLHSMLYGDTEQPARSAVRTDDGRGSAVASACYPDKKVRLVNVSFRLPVAINLLPESNAIRISVATGGGMTSAFKKLEASMDLEWVGLPSGHYGSELHADAALQRAVQQKLASQGSAFTPLYVDPRLVNAHSAFCSGVLWPLFHHMPLQVDGARSYRPTQFEAYEKLNQAVADAAIKLCHAPDDVLWIHDFHLLLVPKLIRARRRDVRMGLFVHVPFPSGELFRTLPTRREILEGMLGADVIGFHTVHYARHFISVCQRVLGLEVRPNGVMYRGGFVSVGIYPMGTDAMAFTRTVRSAKVQRLRSKLVAQFKGKKIVVGVDRVEYIKGIPQKLLAIRRFLEQHPDWLGKVVFVQIGIPVPSKDPQYLLFRNQIFELVGDINSRFGTLESQPVHYREVSLSLEELCALYSISDALLSTSLRDGMNLVAYEYTVCQHENRGVLILSEFTGAALMLPGALLCNPWNLDNVAACVLDALTMARTEKEVRLKKTFRYVFTHTAASWGYSFVSDVVRFAAERNKRMKDVRQLDDSVLQSHLQTSSESSGRDPDLDRGMRVLFLDYDGAVSKALDTRLTRLRLAKLLGDLCSNPRNTVFLLTGGVATRRLQWLHSLGAGLAIEDGYRVLWPKALLASATTAKRRPRLEPVSPLGGGEPESDAQAAAQSAHFTSARTAPSQTRTEPAAVDVAVSLQLAAHGDAKKAALLRSSTMKHVQSDSRLVELDKSEIARDQSRLFGKAHKSRSIRYKDLQQPECDAEPQPGPSGAEPSCVQAPIDSETVGHGPLSDSHNLGVEDEPSTSVDFAAEVMGGFPGMFTSEWETLTTQVDEALLQSELQKAIAILEIFEDMTPGSSLSVQPVSAGWSLGNADAELSVAHSDDARHQLEEALQNSPLQVISGKGEIQIRPRGVSKGACMESIVERLLSTSSVAVDLAGEGDTKYALSPSRPPFLIAAFGDHATDAQMFNTLESLKLTGGVRTLSCSIGRKLENVQFVAATVEDVIEALESLIIP